jgi:hypothetical protein
VLSRLRFALCIGLQFCGLEFGPQSCGFFFRFILLLANSVKWKCLVPEDGLKIDTCPGSAHAHLIALVASLPIDDWTCRQKREACHVWKKEVCVGLDSLFLSFVFCCSLSHEVWCYIPDNLQARSYFMGFLLSRCVLLMVTGRSTKMHIPISIILRLILLFNILANIMRISSKLGP